MVTACPRCAGEMQPGFLGTQTWPSGLQWYAKETEMGFLVGEPVATDHTLQMEYVRGERCTDCRILLLAY